MPWLVSTGVSEGGLAGSVACRPFIRALLLHRVSPGFSLVGLPHGTSARFTSIRSSSASPRPCIAVASIHASDPEFYNIPYVDGIPVGKRLKLWNLPPNCKHSELLEWFGGVDVVVESLEFSDDPALNAQGVGGYVEFATKQDACIAIVRLDGYKFRGHYIRMDFAEKRLRRNRPKHNNGSSRGSSSPSSRTSVTDMVPRNGGAVSSKHQSVPRYEAAITSSAQASFDQGMIPAPVDMGVQSRASSGEGSTHGDKDSLSANGSGIPFDGYGVTQPFTRVNSPTPSYRSSEPSYAIDAGIPQPSGITENIGSTSRHTSHWSSQQQGPISNCTATYVNEGPPQIINPSLSSQSPVAPGHSPSSRYSGYGNSDPYKDPLEGYDAPEQAVLEPWSSKTNFRLGPMYGSQQPSSFNRLFVGNLAPSVNDTSLQQLFSRFGTVLEVSVLREPESGRSRGFGFVAMSSVEEVKAAYEALDGWELDGYPLRMDAAVALKK